MSPLEQLTQTATPTSLHSRRRAGGARRRTLAACRKPEAAAATKKTVVATATPKPLTPREKADEMDRMHEAGIKAFPAKTAARATSS